MCVLTAIVSSLIRWCSLTNSEKTETAGSTLELSDQFNPLFGKSPLDSISMREGRRSLDKSGEIISDELLEKQVSRKQFFKKCVNMFNQNPNKGMKLFIEGEFVKKDAHEIAQFLLKTTELNKAMIGDYLGGGDDFSINVMHSFIDLIKFEGMGFVQALRVFLQLFRLPGESQKIDRIMEKFADRYCIFC